MTDPDEPAYPVPEDFENRGLTKREDFAIKIMAGFAASPFEVKGNNQEEVNQRIYIVAESAVIWADQLIKALNEKV